MGKQTNGEWDVNNHRCGSTLKNSPPWIISRQSAADHQAVHITNTSWNKESFFSELDFDLIIRQEMIPPPIQFNPPLYLESDTLRTKTTLPHGGDTEDENDSPFLTTAQFSDNDSLHSFSSFNVQSKPVFVIRGHTYDSQSVSHRL